MFLLTTGYQNAVGMAGEAKTYAKAPQIIDQGVQDVGVRFAGVAARGADLAEFERAAEDPFAAVFQFPHQAEGIRTNQVFAAVGCQAVIAGKDYRLMGAVPFAGSAKDAESEVKLRVAIL